jgi:hypothetical protein
MSARECDDLLVVEAHAVEDGAEMILQFGGVGEAAIWIGSVSTYSV